MKPVVIAGYARSPFTLARKGELARVRPDDLAATLVEALIERSRSWASTLLRPHRTVVLQEHADRLFHHLFGGNG